MLYIEDNQVWPAVGPLIIVADIGRRYSGTMRMEGLEGGSSIQSEAGGLLEQKAALGSNYSHAWR